MKHTVYGKKECSVKTLLDVVQELAFIRNATMENKNTDALSLMMNMGSRVLLWFYAKNVETD